MRTQCAVFLISAATLLLEVSLTRILSVSHWQPFAFLVISTALLGFGASGVLLAALESITRSAAMRSPPCSQPSSR